MWATAWKGGLAAQVLHVEGLDYSSSVDSVPGPLDLTHSAVGETSPSLCCCSQIGPQCFPVTTCWHFEGLLPSCPSFCLPLLLEQTLRFQEGLCLAVVVSPTLVFGFPGFMLSAARGCWVLVGVFPWEGLGRFKTYAPDPIFLEFHFFI